MFDVRSTSVETTAIKRVVRVLERLAAEDHPNAADFISYGGVYICKVISGSTTFSQHSWGNAIDLFPRASGSTGQTELRAIANMLVFQATHRTKANGYRKLPVAEVIDHDARRIWTPDRGWHAYTGTTGAHIHISGSPLKSGTPPCAR